jgi:hypothetical protein
MNELVSGAAAELLAVIGSGIGATAFTTGGLVAKQDGLRKIILGYGEFWRRLQTLRSLPAFRRAVRTAV